MRLADFALSGGAEFEDPSSYQSAALRRVEEQVGAEDMSDIKLIQYYALYSIFEATNAKPNDFIITSRTFGDDLSDIPGWTTTTGWLDTNLDPCADSWFGVSCNNDQVVSLDLFDNGLTGNFAPEVKLLAGDGFYATGAGSLESLDIFNNENLSNNGDNSWIADLGSSLGTCYRPTESRIPEKKRPCHAMVISIFNTHTCRYLLSSSLQVSFTCKTQDFRVDYHRDCQRAWSTWILPIL